MKPKIVVTHIRPRNHIEGRLPDEWVIEGFWPDRRICIPVFREPSRERAELRVARLRRGRLEEATVEWVETHSSLTRQ